MTKIWNNIEGIGIAILITGLLIGFGFFVDNLNTKTNTKNAAYSICKEGNIKNTVILVRECWKNLAGSSTPYLSDAIESCRIETEIMICRR